MPIKVHSKEFFFETIEELELLLEEDIDIVIPSTEDISNNTNTNNYFHLDKTMYLTALEKALPIENIFKWIYDEMEKHNQLSYKNYCITLSLLDRIDVSYSKSDRDMLMFETCELSVPIAKSTTIIRGDNHGV